MFHDQKDVETILSALGEQLEEIANKPLELLVCGGSALNFLGLVQRATKDVDVLAYVNRNTEGEVSFISADPFTSWVDMIRFTLSSMQQWTRVPGSILMTFWPSTRHQVNWNKRPAGA